MKKKRKRGLLPDTFGAYVIDNVLVAGDYKLPVVGYFGDELPDYIALYSNVSEYRLTENTCVSFFQYDSQFDSVHGLWNSIIYKDERKLEKFRNRFKDVKYIVCPDYSITGDMPPAMQIFNVYRSRVVAIWLRENCGCIIIPNLRFNNKESYKFCFDGIAYKSIVCLSILGLCAKQVDVQNLIDGLHETIKRICPPIIIVYGNCLEEKFNRIFYESIKAGIKIIQVKSRADKLWRYHYGVTK